MRGVREVLQGSAKSGLRVHCTALGQGRRHTSLRARHPDATQVVHASTACLSVRAFTTLARRYAPGVWANLQRVGHNGPTTSAINNNNGSM